MPEDTHITSGLAFTPHDVKVPNEPAAETAAPAQEAAPLPQNGPTSEDVRNAARAAMERQKQEAMVAERERKKREFMEKVADARRPQVQVNVPQPVAPAILSQTARELAQEARHNQIHAERRRTGTVQPSPDTQLPHLFRPGDHVPNMNQGQNGLPGNVKAL
jgi:hypothetical protein